MENNKQFTNEELAKKFKNNFILVNYAISLAENMIQSGRDTRVRRTDLQNRAMLILEEIREGQDKFDDIGGDNGKTSVLGEPSVNKDYRRDARPARMEIEDSDFGDDDDEPEED